MSAPVTKTPAKKTSAKKTPSKKVASKMTSSKVSLSKGASKAAATKAASKNAPSKKPAAKRPAAKAAEPRVIATIESGAAKSSFAAGVTRRAEAMLDVLGLRTVEVSLAFVSDDTIQELNKKFRKKDKPTDVLSFPLHDLPTSDLIAAASASSVLLGDIVVSVPTADRQARERSRTLVDEVTTLVAHGLLHLLGFDHRTDDEEREMDAYARVLEAAATNKRPVRFALAPR